MWLWDPIYFIFALPALLFALYAQYKVHSSYSRYSRIRNRLGVEGVRAAEILLRYNGLQGVNIEGVPGTLTDHYDPRTKTLRLSAEVARMPSIAAIGIVAHEVGHAVQDAENYPPLRLRAGLVPMVNLGSWLGPILFFVGLLLNAFDLAAIGLILFSLGAVFALVTLPVEFNASKRAMRMLQETGLVSLEDLKGVKSVLSAAALTYVAALAQAISTLFYYAFLLFGLRREE
ncbi:MAG: zinc metallopeptidase [Anaerolineae bacterium]|nr:zinc metallopeptidase [Anaerolineae bacterium]MDW8101467.1 zinc metallopeptidase [Anaerolineae bacterium]